MYLIDMILDTVVRSGLVFNGWDITFERLIHVEYNFLNDKKVETEKYRVSSYKDGGFRYMNNGELMDEDELYSSFDQFILSLQ